MLYLTIILLSTLGLIASQCIIKCILKNLNKKTKDSLESIRCSDEKLNQSITSFSFSKEVSDKTNFLTCLVSFIEALFYFGLTILFFKEFNFSTENIIHFLQIIGGWLGIKTLGNFGQWADEHLGRASFYLYLIGSLLNLLFSFFIGLAVCYLLFKHNFIIYLISCLLSLIIQIILSYLDSGAC